MALLRIDHEPETVGMNLPLNLILPEPAALKGKALEDSPTLYLLHGLSDDASAWTRYSVIEDLARDYGLVVVMPSAGRSLYADMDNGQRYFSYVTEELPAYLHQLLRLTTAREKTFIAGLSMGGYGAFKAACLKPERYAAALSLSGLLVVDPAMIPPDKAFDPQLMHEFDLVFGGLAKVAGSTNDPVTWLKMIAADPARYPRLYLSCGTEDDLLDMSRYFANGLKQAGVPVDYEEHPGGHTWPYWNKHIAVWLRKILPEPESRLSGV
ncbi:MAG: alpha/beta fold hydrolase [Chloroflexi bacterium]|nr:alpha/beta fold hydrolase [Chloroflexota bacterium]